MTDFAEEKEILSTGNELEEALIAIRNKQAQKTAERLARERELSKVFEIFSFVIKNKVQTYSLRRTTEDILHTCKACIKL